MSLENQMNTILEKMGIPLKAVWLPSDDSKEHARIILEESLLMVYDKDENEAMRRLLHEILEYRFRFIVSPYRELCNKLIEAVEQITYKEKERALDQIAKDFQVWKELGDLRAPTSHRIRGVLKKDE